jgi:hypothetical protein
MNFFTLPNSSGRTMAMGFTQPLTEMSTRRTIWGVERGRCIGLTTLLPPVSQLFRQCGILNISQPYRPPRPGTGIAFTFFIVLAYHRHKPIDSS